MPSIGDTLREARMRQRLDIADVETRTKIRAKYLRALENEEFGLLPGSTFVRTFLRTYAEVLGLDPHALVEEYRTNFEPREEQMEVPIGPSPAGGNGGGGPGRERRYPGGAPAPGRGMVIVAAVVGLLIGLIVLGVTAGNEDNKGNKSAQTTDKQKAKKRKRKRPKPLPAAVTLKVKPVTPTYVCVDTGPGSTIVYQGILQQERTFKAKKIRVNLGKSTVELQENGKPVRFQQTANPVGFEFSTTGHKELDTGQRPCASPSTTQGTTTGA
jgi:cytoskeleton protein RodZ